MDTVSSIAGLIALAALAAQTTAQTVNTLKTLKELPDDLRTILGWLDRLSSLLKSVQLIPPDTPIEAPQLQLLGVHVRVASDAVACLSTKIKGDIVSLDTSHGVKRQAKKVQVFLGTKGTEKQVQDVRQAVETLHLYHSEISRQVLCKTHSDVMSVSGKLDQTILLGDGTNAKLDDISFQVRNLNLTGNREEELLRQISANFRNRSSRLEKSVRNIDASFARGASFHASLQQDLKASLIAEVKSAVFQGLKDRCDEVVLQRINRETTLPMSNSMTVLSEGEKVQCITDEQTSSDIQVDTSFQGFGQHYSSDEVHRAGIEEAQGPLIPNSPFMTSPFVMPVGSVQTACIPSYRHQLTGYEKITIFSYRTSLSWLGSLTILVFRRIIATNDWIHPVIILKISIAPNPRFLSRGLRFSMHWDDEKSQHSSLTNIRLYLPRILREDDPLVESLDDGATEEFVRLFRSGGYSVRDEVFNESSGRSLGLVDAAFYLPGKSDDISSFLLRHGAQLPLAVWQVCIGYYLRVDSYKALEFTRQVMTNGTTIDAMPLLPPVAFEMVLNAISACPNSVPDWVIHSNHNWSQKLQIPYLISDNIFYDVNYNVDKDALLWESLMERSQADVRQEGPWGDTCWSELLEFCRYNDRYQLENLTLKRVFKTRVDGLLRMHADPCKTNARGVTPTIQAFTSCDLWGTDLDLGALIGPAWLSALAASNVNVTAIARHSFQVCWDNYELLDMLNSRCNFGDDAWCEHDECQRSPFGSIEGLQCFLLNAFAECGIYPDESWWVEGEPGEWNISATAVDFVPRTMYDVGTQDMEVKRRKGRTVEEE